MDSSIGVFISYSHENRFEAATLAQELTKIGCQCWIDFNGIVGGDLWRESINKALESSHATVIILTPEAIASSWVSYEIKKAREHGHIIIPVMFRQCPLPDMLEPFQYIDFTRGPNYERLFQSVVIGVFGQIRTKVQKVNQNQNLGYISQAQAVIAPPIENLTLERPDGTMRAESLFYIERQGDHVLQREISGEGATIVIKAPRQVGKSSMLIRSIKHGQAVGKKVALLDFQSLDTLSDPQLFYQEFSAAISDRLGLENKTTEVWKRARSNTRACTIYMEHILTHLASPLVLGIDETDRMFDCPFRSDFFGMLRSWHNSRGPGSIWRKFDMILVISTEPYMLIENTAQSPFNVGEIIELEDFSAVNVEMLNERHGSPFSKLELTALYDLTAGHPYLVRQALYRVAVNATTAASILDISNYTRGGGGIFADHLHRYQSYFKEQPQLRPLMLDIIQGASNPTDDDLHRLSGAGLIKITEDQQIVPRCKLYSQYFGAKLK